MIFFIRYLFSICWFYLNIWFMRCGCVDMTDFNSQDFRKLQSTNFWEKKEHCCIHKLKSLSLVGLRGSRFHLSFSFHFYVINIYPGFKKWSIALKLATQWDGCNIQVGKIPAFEGNCLAAPFKFLLKIFIWPTLATNRDLRIFETVYLFEWGLLLRQFLCLNEDCC